MRDCSLVLKRFVTRTLARSAALAALLPGAAAALIKKARQEARARSASPEEESQAVADALKELAAEEKGGD